MRIGARESAARSSPPVAWYEGRNDDVTHLGRLRRALLPGVQPSDELGHEIQRFVCDRLSAYT
jgi:hypothetical protein